MGTFLIHNETDSNLQHGESPSTSEALGAKFKALTELMTSWHAVTTLITGLWLRAFGASRRGSLDRLLMAIAWLVMILCFFSLFCIRATNPVDPSSRWYISKKDFHPTTLIVLMTGCRTTLPYSQQHEEKTTKMKQLLSSLCCWFSLKTKPPREEILERVAEDGKKHYHQKHLMT